MQHSLNLRVELRLVRGGLVVNPLVVAKQALLLWLHLGWLRVDHHLLVKHRLVVLRCQRIIVVVLEGVKELLAQLASALRTHVGQCNLVYLLFKQFVEVGLEFAVSRADGLRGAGGLEKVLHALKPLVELIIDSREVHEASVAHLLIGIHIRPHFRHCTTVVLAHHEF